jgi:hypothetical protein
MSRPAKWSVAVLAMLMLQVLAVLSQTYVIENSKSAFNTDSSEFDDDYFEHTHPLESLISIESTLGDKGSYEISVTSELEAQISLEVISPDILDLPFGRSTPSTGTLTSPSSPMRSRPRATTSGSSTRS